MKFEECINNLPKAYTIDGSRYFKVTDILDLLEDLHQLHMSEVKSLLDLHDADVKSLKMHDEVEDAIRLRSRKLLNHINNLNLAMCLLRAHNAMGEFLHCDHVDEGNPKLWLDTRDYWEMRAREMKNA